MTLVCGREIKKEKENQQILLNHITILHGGGANEQKTEIITIVINT